jgi:hypothetical protein
VKGGGERRDDGTEGECKREEKARKRKTEPRAGSVS